MNEHIPLPDTTPTSFVRRVAQLCACSYAEAEQAIIDGGVRVAGFIVTDPAHDIANAQIVIEPAAHPDTIEPISVLLHKPAQCTLTQARALFAPSSRAATDVSGIDLQPRHFRGHTIMLPLEDAASGLMVLTQDQRVRRRLTEDALEQEYVVEVDGDRGPYVLGQLLRAAPYLGKNREPYKVSWQSETRLRFAIKEPQPGELHYLCAQGALRIVAMRRLRIGRIALARLPLGEWRALGDGEKF